MDIKEFIIAVYNTCVDPVFLFSFVICMILYKLFSFIVDEIFNSIKNYIYISEKAKRKKNEH